MCANSSGSVSVSWEPRVTLCDDVGSVAFLAFAKRVRVGGVIGEGGDTRAIVVSDNGRRRRRVNLGDLETFLGASAMAATTINTRPSQPERITMDLVANMTSGRHYMRRPIQQSVT